MLKEISIEIIRKCPNKCVHCSSLSSVDCTEIIPFQVFEKTVNRAIDLGVKTICLSGGEPFLHPDIEKMINLIALKKKDSYIYSSGIFLARDKICPVPSDLLKNIAPYVTKIIFNIETSDPKTYKEIMGTDGFEIMKQSVFLSNKYGIPTEAHFVPMKLNAKQIDSTIKLCNDLGISKISFLRLVPHGRGATNFNKIALNKDETESLKKKLLALKQKNDIDIRIGVPLVEGNHKDECEAAKGKLNIRYDGLVYPCEIFKNNKIQLLNSELKPESIYVKPLDEIYIESLFLNNIRQCVNNYTKKSTCENCIGQDFINNIKQ